MLKRLPLSLLAASLLAAAIPAVPALAQESDYGVSLPVTISGGGFYSHRLQLSDRKDNPGAAGFRVMLYPTIKLSSHWFAYAAFQARSMPYFYYDAFFSDRKEIYTDVVQAYIGYTFRRGRTTVVFKAGHLSTAFGSFPLRYDDTENAVIDQPLSYITEIPVRADQITCGVKDQLQQFYGSVDASCGGLRGRGPGLMPVTLYGLPAVQGEISSGRVDARVQITGGSPANPMSFAHAAQYLQWTVGGGYTIRQGFRVGGSAFRGPYLDRDLESVLPAGTSIRDFPATGLGLDVQWARGWWSAHGEIHHFTFAGPNWVVAPNVTSSYAEMKRTLTPRFYLAGRAGRLTTGRVVDVQGLSLPHIGSAMTSIELAAGAWLNRHQSLKVSYSCLKPEGTLSSQFNVIGFQLVTTLRAFDKTFR